MAATTREEAIADCKYAKSLGTVALNEHFNHWFGFPPSMEMKADYEYWCVLGEIREKLDTDECLLR